jgi:hypothetical protein
MSFIAWGCYRKVLEVLKVLKVLEVLEVLKVLDVRQTGRRRHDHVIPNEAAGRLWGPTNQSAAEVRDPYDLSLQGRAPKIDLHQKRKTSVYKEIKAVRLAA